MLEFQWVLSPFPGEVGKIIPTCRSWNVIRTLIHSYGTCHFRGVIYTPFSTEGVGIFLPFLNCLNMTEGSIHLTVFKPHSGCLCLSSPHCSLCPGDRGLGALGHGLSVWTHSCLKLKWGASTSTISFFIDCKWCSCCLPCVWM